jgi:hypothetical protein
MGAWGILALESDEGLDVVDALARLVAGQPEGAVVLTLGEMISLMKGEEFFGGDFEEIDFLYDNSAMALAELYLHFQENGELDYDDEEEAGNLRKRVKSFTADEASLDFILHYLTDIRDEKPDADGEREIVELWRDSESWEEWREHLAALVTRLNEEKAKCRLEAE